MGAGTGLYNLILEKKKKKKKIQILGPPYKFWINQTSSYFIEVEGTDVTVGSHIIKCSAFWGVSWSHIIKSW